MQSHVIVDIETAGVPFEDIDARMQSYLLRFANTVEEAQEEKQRINLYPFTARMVCIGMLNPDSGQARILLNEPDGGEWSCADGRAACSCMEEADLLRQFWEDIRRYDRMVTFNGRMFDAPFILLRSAMLGVHASVDLMPPRYGGGRHVDLMERFTFKGTTRRFSLDFICTAFGIDSPKRHGVTGHDMNDLFARKEYEMIAEYNFRDLEATAELFRIWEEFLTIR